VLLVEQNANMALHIADYGYVLEVGRIVMEDTCARLLEKDDIKEFYLGMKEQSVRGTRRWKRKKTWPLSGPATVHGQDTLARLFRHVVRQRGDAVAMREKVSAWAGRHLARLWRARPAVGLGWWPLGLRPRRRGVDPRGETGGWLYTIWDDVGGRA